MAIEFTGKFLQGHFIIGQTDPTAKIIIDKKQVKVSDDGFFVFGLDRDCLLYTSDAADDQ